VRWGVLKNWFDELSTSHVRAWNIHNVSGWFFSGWVTARKSLRALAVFRQKTCR
jgi:hypothetical protein